MVLGLAAAVSAAQVTKPGQISRPAGADEVVRRALHGFAEGGYDGWTQKWLARLGDGSAAALARIYSGRDLSPRDVATALEVIDMSFLGLKDVEVASERQPRATLFVLRYFDAITTDPSLKNKIRTTRESVLKRTSQAKERTKP